ncbi:MAG: adenylosuccinate synthetase [Candidatus Woesearchaeota archaeon]|jgi:adenylosuccinate synthase
MITELTPQITPQLMEILTKKYYISSYPKTVGKLVRNNEITNTPGAFFGDEGKGKIIAALSNDELIKMLIKANSGENQGHTQYINGIKYVFALMPSGIFKKKLINAIGPECVFDPISFMEREVSQLLKNNIPYDNLYIGNVHIVTPYHKIIDKIANPKNSSTLKGMSPAHISKVWKRGLRLDDLFNDKKEQKKIIEKDIELYNMMLKYKKITEKQIIKDFLKDEKKGRKTPKHIYGFLAAKDKAKYLVNLYEKEVKNNKLFPKRADVNYMARQVLKKGGKILIEPAQAYNLSNGVETHWKSSTSAQTHSAGTIASCLVNSQKYKILTINVQKGPISSRVGIGANPSGFVSQSYFSEQDMDTSKELEGKCTDFNAIQKMFFECISPNGILVSKMYKDKDGKKYPINEAMAIASSTFFGELGSTTGKPRVTGLFDCLAHKQVMDVQGPYTLISAMDRGDYLDKIGLVVAYKYVGNKVIDCNGIKYKKGHIIRINDQYPNERVLKYCIPIIKVISGWKNHPINAEKRNKNDPLPKEVQNYIGTIDRLCGSETIVIGNGKETENLIYLKQVA